MSSAPITVEPHTSTLLPALCAAACALALLAYGPITVRFLRPAPGVYPDFVQEWLSARNFWTGAPVYSPQREALLRHGGVDRPKLDAELPWNAHPPVAVLIALPFGLFTDYPAAHLSWNIVTLSLFVLALALAARELGVPLAWWTLAGGTALVLSCHAVLNHLYQGQLNFIVFVLLVLAWRADRRGQPGAAGLAAGAAAAIKLFPALVLVYFVAAGRWRAALAAALTALGLNLAALTLFGPEEFGTYVREVLPSLDVFRGSWLNVSLTGYWTRVGASLHAPVLGAGAASVCQLAVVAAVWWAGRRAPSPDARDRAFAAAVVGMPLASPVAWSHYFVILALPLLVMWRRSPRGPALLGLLVASAVLWLPERLVFEFLVGPDEIPTDGHLAAYRPVTAIVGLGPFTFALVALFVATTLARPARAPRPAVPNGTTQTADQVCRNGLK